MAAKKKHVGGRPTKFRDEFCEQGEWLSKLGATDSEMAAFFDVTESTLNKWKLDYPEFSESLKAGKVMADCRVAQSLYEQAISGNTTAQIFWLKNRRKLSWRDKQEIDHTTGGDKITQPAIIFKDPAKE